MLAIDRQLDDIVRFCVKSNGSVFGVNPTFNICKHNVALTTVQHPLHPILLSPVLLHGEKTFESCYSVLSALVR